jgi:hypothetical protein
MNIQIYVYLYTYIYACMNARMRICIYIHMYIRVWMYICIHICAYVNKYTYIYINVYTPYRTAHGPDASTYVRASCSGASLNPEYFDKGLAFMFETMYILKINPEALRTSRLQRSYSQCWGGLPVVFDGSMHPPPPIKGEK